MAKEQKSFGKFVFVDADGKDIAEPGPDVERMEIRFKDGAFDTISFDVNDLPADTQVAAKWHGAKQKINDFTNAASRKLPDEERYEEVLSLVERLIAGDWLKPSEAAGPRTSTIFDAVMRVYDAAGREVDDDFKAEVRELLKAKAERDSAMANPKVKLAYEQIKIERQTARIAKLQTAAAAVDDDEALPFGEATSA